MMITRILMVSAAVAAVAAGTSLAHAQNYSTPPGAVYSPYPPSDYRRAPGVPDYDSVDDEDAPNGQSSTALPPPGPVLSPDDPRYGRPAGGPPVYS
ncbi:MAG: L,D-transpeptidase, partial [Bradyrhizobium sp.]